VAILADGRFAALGPLDEVLASEDPTVHAFLQGEAR
jgi:ABC-type transporter Mla maintaining outer membrane lipid asymmetry ATPase subunit MlaF